jgi:hypothetical protein
MLNPIQEIDFLKNYNNNPTISLRNRDFVSKCKKINLILRHKMFTFIFESSAELYLNSIILEILSTDQCA